MEKVEEDLGAINDSTVNPLGTYKQIREICTLAAIAITQAAKLKMTEGEATEEIERIHLEFHKFGRALGAITPTNQKIAVCTIAVDAIRIVAQKAATGSKEYRANAWVFAITSMANGAASNIMMELHYS